MGLWFKLGSYICLLFFFNWTFLFSEECSLFIFHFSSIPFICHCLLSFLLPENLLSKGENRKTLPLTTVKLEKACCWPNLDNPGIILRGSSFPGSPHLCPHAPALTYVPGGHGELCLWETGRNSEQMVLLNSWVMLQNTFLLGVIIWLHSLIKVDLCDGYVIYIFLPLFLQDSGCIS